MVVIAESNSNGNGNAACDKRESSFEEEEAVNENVKILDESQSNALVSDDIVIGGEDRDDNNVIDRDGMSLSSSSSSIEDECMDNDGDHDLIKTLVDTKKKELEAIIRTRDIIIIQTTASPTNELKSPRSLSASTATSKTRRRKNKGMNMSSNCNYSSSDNNNKKAEAEADIEFYNDLRSKPLSCVAAKHAKRFALYWKHEVKEKICILRILECGKQDEIIQEAINVGLFGGKCKVPEWNFEMSVKEKPTMFKNNMCITVDNAERTIVVAQSDFLVKAALDQGNDRVDALLEEKVARLFLHAEQLLKNRYPFSNKPATTTNTAASSSSSPTGKNIIANIHHTDIEIENNLHHNNNVNVNDEHGHEDEESIRTINNVFTEEELGDYFANDDNETETTLLGYYSTARLRRWLATNSTWHCDDIYNNNDNDDDQQRQPCIEVIIRDGKEWVLPRNYSTLKAKNDINDHHQHQHQHHRRNDNDNYFSYYFNDNTNNYNYCNDMHNEYHYNTVFTENSCAPSYISSENIKAAEEFGAKSKVIAKYIFRVTYDFIQKVIYEAERSFQGSDVVRICRNFVCEDITLLQESFRRGNLQRNNNKQNNNDKTKDSASTTTTKVTIIDPPNSNHVYQEEKLSSLNVPEQQQSSKLNPDLK